MARELKDSGITWAGQIPVNWDSMPFWQAIERMGTGLNPRDNFELTKEDQRYYVTIRNFKDGILYLDDECDRISEEAWEIIQERSDLHKGDILFASISKDGQAYILTAEPDNWNINESVFCIRVNQSLYDNKFFYYHLINSAYYEDLRRDATGSTFQSIKQNKLRKSRLVHPTVSEQKRIATYLDAECLQIDSIIEKTRTSIVEYRKLKQAVITQAVTKGIRPNRQMKGSGIEWIGNIPLDWEIANLGMVTLSMRNGYVGPTKDLFCNEGIQYIQSLHIKDGMIDFSRREYYVSEQWAKDHPKIKENDILIVQTGEIGEVGLVSKEFDNCNCHALIIATPNKEKIIPRFLTYYLRSTVGRELLLYYKTGALLPHLNSGKIKFASICIPSIEEQNEINDHLDKEIDRIEKLIANKSLLLEELEQYRKSLIFEYITGKKEVV